MKTMNTCPRISWHRIRNFAAIVRSPAPVRDAFTGHPLLRVWWKSILALHGKRVGDGQLAPEHWNCVADGFRFYGWLYRFVAVALLAMAAWAAASGLAGVYWLGFMIAGAFGLWCAAGLAFAGASDLLRTVQEGICKLVVFLFLVALFLVSILMAISVEAKAAELLSDFANLMLTMLLLAFGLGSYLIEVVALVTAREPLATQG